MIDHLEAETEALELSATELDAAVGGLTKAGPGTLILNSTNTYAGVTRVNEGIIAI